MMQSAISADRPTTFAELAVLLQVSPMRGNQSADYDEGDWVPEAETPPSSRSGCFKLDFDVSSSPCTSADAQHAITATLAACEC